jgi:hypothetical protein|eukprot:COSAG01_NODE_509_length_16084_cov_18.063180_6_plen_109_part_00
MWMHYFLPAVSAVGATDYRVYITRSTTRGGEEARGVIVGKGPASAFAVGFGAVSGVFNAQPNVVDKQVVHVALAGPQFALADGSQLLYMIDVDNQVHLYPDTDEAKQM